jgi:Flp pilus assembly protein TadG
MKPSPMIASPLLRRLIARAHDLQADRSRAAAALVRRLLDDTAGMAAVEFAILSPVLLAMLLGMFSFGLAMKDYMVLTNAANQGALTIALSRGTATPYTTTQNAITAATTSLTTSTSVSTTITINSVACTSDSICTTNLVAGRSALVTATYPCTLSVMGINYKPNGCTLTASTAQMIQ